MTLFSHSTIRVVQIEMMNILGINYLETIKTHVHYVLVSER